MYRNVIQITLMPLKPGLDGLLLDELALIVETSRQFSGCLAFDLYRLTAQPSTIVLHEVWETRDAYHAHCHSSHRSEFNRIVTASLARPIETWGVEEICLTTAGD